jgi:hypothetical protein
MANFGPRTVFDAITLINVGICALTIPAYVFGKRFRSFVSVMLLRVLEDVLMYVDRLRGVALGRNYRVRAGPIYDWKRDDDKFCTSGTIDKDFADFHIWVRKVWNLYTCHVHHAIEIFFSSSLHHRGTELWGCGKILGW